MTRMQPIIGLVLVVSFSFSVNSFEAHMYENDSSQGIIKDGFTK